MFVAPISNQNFTALVPASQYKGPVLKLTPKDKKKIAELVSKKAISSELEASMKEVYTNFTNDFVNALGK